MGMGLVEVNDLGHSGRIRHGGRVRGRRGGRITVNITQVGGGFNRLGERACVPLAGAVLPAGVSGEA